jgi:hypothetical protein
MKILEDSLLIASTPPEILVGLGIFFCISALILLALAAEEGRYPELGHWLGGLKRVNFLQRRVGRRWMFEYRYWREIFEH